jgi:membrane-associated protease RseP (regulator of RpoE activity)
MDPAAQWVTRPGIDPGPTPLPVAVAPAPRWWLASGLLLATFFTTTTLGAYWTLASRTDVVTTLLPLLGPETVRAVWSSPELIGIGLGFSVPVLLILLCHELGHYLACRRYGVHATLPYFVPAPIALGTLGAFIRIRSPIRDKRQLFDIGIAGPLAGFAALLPILVYGIARSRPTPLAVATTDAEWGGTILLQPGDSLAMELVTRLVHGALPAGTVLDLHPFALAAWVGLLATSLNLLPLGQLDGGHLLYAVFGSRQRRLVLPLWLLLVAAGLFWWKGWLLWATIVLVIGLRHPPLWDERVPLGRGRLALAVVALLLLVLCFMPVPLVELPVAG